jgi:hypothetical protein
MILQAQIVVKQGLRANLPTLATGELAFCTDTYELWVGTPTGNLLITSETHYEHVLLQDGSRPGALLSSQEFVQGIRTGLIKVREDSATAFQVLKATGDQAVILDVSTDTVRMGIGTVPQNALHVIGTIRMTQGISANAGTANLPAYRFSDDNDTGMYRPGVGGLGFAVDGVQVIGITTNKRLQLLTPDGTAPFDLISTTVNTNLNADMVDGQHANAFWSITDATIDGGYFLDIYSGSPFSVDGGSFV